MKKPARLLLGLNLSGEDVLGLGLSCVVVDLIQVLEDFIDGGYFGVIDFFGDTHNLFDRLGDWFCN